jgi:hypothetical protein
MSAIREDDGELHPAALERLKAEQNATAWARKRLIGSWALGLISLWKLLTVHTDPYLWVLTAAAAFGLANWEQLVAAMPRKGGGD